MTARRFEFKASRWPWQAGYNWRGMTSCSAPLNSGGARFGAGWKYKLGFSTAGWSENGIGVSFDLLFGIVNIRYRTSRGIAAERAYQDQRAQWKRDQEERDRQRERLRQEAEDRTRVSREREAARRAALTPEERQAEDDLPF